MDQFYAATCFLFTLRLTGGNTDEFYDAEGTYNKSLMLQAIHPDVSEVKWKYNRWHHIVNYKPFKANKLKFIDGYDGYDGYDSNDGYDSKTNAAETANFSTTRLKI